MTQYKAKASSSDKEMLGLFSYPTLMTADILLYDATHVPVGDDQTQHLELARALAVSFNARYSGGSDKGKSTNDNTTHLCQHRMIIPETLYTSFPRVMSLRDGMSKMSKSERSDMSRINLTDTPDTIQKKVRKAVTDSIDGITYEPDTRPSLANLIRMFAAVCEEGITPDEVAAEFATRGKAEFKQRLADVLVAAIDPVQSQINRLLTEDTGELDRLIAAGGQEADDIAQRNVESIKRTIGFMA